MYCNFTKCQAFPFAIRVSSQQPRFLIKLYAIPKTPQCSPNSNPKNPICCSTVMKYKNPSFGVLEKTHEFGQLVGTSVGRDSSVGFSGITAKSGCFSIGVHSKPRKFSSGAVAAQVDAKPLPWLAKYQGNEAKNTKNVRSSSEESAEKFLKKGEENRVKGRGFHGKNGYKERNKNPGDDRATKKAVRSSWEESAQKFVKGGSRGVEDRVTSRRFDGRNRRGSEDDSDAEGQETDNPRWYKIQDRFDRFDGTGNMERSNGNEFRKWNNRQDDWGKKVWKETSESSIPKMVGECVYGVGPVLAALSANRREFYAIYVQQGLDLSGNNKKKKDKKGFEKALKAAEKLGLTKKEVPKHDLNMIVDNRPHQGLVLDASPLEMVNIRELDRVAANEHESGPLWVALDEVMDPQNLGAIIRSSYFFGASGVVLCAKNSAPLSGVVSKASAGSLELTELRSCKNMMQFLVSSAENGWRVLGGSVSSRAVSLNKVTTGEPTILVLGSEGTGLRPLVERSCTQLVKICGNLPVHVGSGLEDVETEEFKSFLAVESLNVSVAAGVLMHHLIGTNNNTTALDSKG